MSKKSVVAVIHPSKQRPVIEALQDMNVPGVSIMPIKGYGEYINSFSTDSLSESIRMEVLIEESQVEKVVNTILDNAWSGQAGDGVVTVSDVQSVYRVRDKQQVA